VNDVTKAPDELERSRMTFGEHLTELRARLIKALLATVATVVLGTIFADDLVRFLVAPFQNVMRSINGSPALVSTGPTTPLIVYFKVSIIAGLIVAGPVWIYQIWAFIAAGLYSRERRWVLRFAPMSLVLFIGGVTFGYAVLLPIALRWLLTFPSPDLIQNWITIDSYMSLFTTLTLLLGVAFQLPVVMLGLAKAGIVTADGFRKKRKIVILLIFLVAGILTPPDPITQPLVAIPLWGLFELGIMLAWFAAGEGRPPVQWGRWRKRALWIAAAAAVLFVFRKKIADVWGGVDADARTQSAASALPWKRVGLHVLGAPPDGSLRVNDDATSPELVIVSGPRIALVRFVRSEEPAVVITSESREATAIVVPTGATTWEFRLPADAKLSALGPVVEALRIGDADTRKVARAIGQAAMGAALPPDDGEAARVLEEWLAPRREAAFPQPR
jgi:sec-independent protein translocase protein TatC